MSGSAELGHLGEEHLADIGLRRFCFLNFRLIRFGIVDRNEVVGVDRLGGFLTGDMLIVVLY